MSKLQKVITTTVFACTLMLATGCSDNGTSGTPPSSGIKDDGNKSGPVISNSDIATLLVDQSSQNITIKDNGETRTIKVKAFDAANAPVESGIIKINYPSEISQGVDVGTMNPSVEANITKGIATFTYTAPKDLKALTSNGIGGAIFSFSDKANATTSINLPISYSPNADPIDTAKYKIELLNDAGAASINLEAKTPITVTVKEVLGDLVKTDNIISARISTSNPNIAKLLDGEIEVDSIEYSKENPKTINLQTFKFAGLIDIEIELSMLDKNGKTLDITERVGITVLSGPPTAMSINYVDSDKVQENGQYTEGFVINLTDKYDNPVNTQPKISVGAMAGYAKESIVNAATSGLLYAAPKGVNTNAAGVIGRENGNAILDVSGGYDLSQIDLSNDYLVTFGNGYSYHASGKWDLDSIETTRLTMKDTFNALNAEPNMAFAVGHNYRQDRCRFGKEWIATVDSRDGTYQADKEGNIHGLISYDYYLMGKDIILYANLIGTLNEEGKEYRLGEATKTTLRGDLVAVPEKGYTVPKGAVGRIANFDIHHADSGEWYRNANFGYALEITGDAQCSLVGESDYRTCTNDGIAYVTYSCSAIEGGSISVVDVTPAREFN